MLEGLQRLRANNYRFTLSDRAKENMTEAVQDGNHIIEFLALDGYICFKADSEVSYKDLYTVYKLWCEDNTVNALSAKSFGSFLKQNEAAYNLEYTNKIHIGNGKYAWAFWGLRCSNGYFRRNHRVSSKQVYHPYQMYQRRRVHMVHEK